MADFRQRPEFLRGRAGEQAVVGWLQKWGWYVIPSYDYSGENGDKAPKLEGIRDRFPVPDLDVAMKGKRRWVEVKTKKAASWGIVGQQWEHGIEHYKDYIRVAKETGTEAWLAILETDTVSTSDLFGVAGTVLMQSFTQLGQPRTSGMRHGARTKPMAYFPRDSFKLVTNLRAEYLLALENAGVTGSWREDN
jgi:hypothetical protein